MTRLSDAGRRLSRGLLLPSQPLRASPLSPLAQVDSAFEFAHTTASDMCAADDVFFRGQLLPFKPPPPPSLSPAASPTPVRPVPKFHTEGRHHGRRHRRTESLDVYERGSGAAARYWRTKGSVSADYQRLRPTAEDPCDLPRPSPRPASAGAAAAPPRPKWYMLLFGSVKVPAETDMKSIKSRLQRRSSDGLRGDSPGKPVPSGGAAWKVLRSLSCKGDVAGAVDAPSRSYGLA